MEIRRSFRYLHPYTSFRIVDDRVIDKEFPVANSIITKEMEEYLDANLIKYEDSRIFNPNKRDEFYRLFPQMTGFSPIKRISGHWFPNSTFTYK